METVPNIKLKARHCKRFKNICYEIQAITSDPGNIPILRAKKLIKLTNARGISRDAICSCRYLTDDQTSRERLRAGYLFPEYPSRRRITVHCDFHAAARYDSGSAFRRGERERRVFRQRGRRSLSPRSSKFAVYLNRSRAYARPVRENLRSRSPDGHVNNLSVLFHRRPGPPASPQPVAPRRVWKIWSRRVPRSTCFSECACTCVPPVHTSARYTVKTRDRCILDVRGNGDFEARVAIYGIEELLIYRPGRCRTTIFISLATLFLPLFFFPSSLLWPCYFLIYFTRRSCFIRCLPW